MKQLPLIFTLVAMTLMAASSSPVYAGPLPPLINFQSVLLDEGGNLLPSGPATVQFQILDENHEAIYFENQTVDVVKGAVSALVGNGSNDQGITTGGIPEDVFATGAPRYLQVQVGAQAPEEPMTIVSVPYSQWSQTSATVADGAVSGAKIAEAAVGFEHLAPDLMGKLADELSKSHGILTTQSLASIGGATQIGVTAKFINSGSSSVQGVLQDIDLSVKKGQEQDQFLLGKLKDEIKDRTDAVDGVQKKLDKEITDRGLADGTLQTNITKEADARAVADGGLQSQITPLQTSLSDINNIPGQLSLSKVNTTLATLTYLDMGGHKIINLSTPSEDAQAANKSYVDGTVKIGTDEAKAHADDNFKSAPSNLNMDGKLINNLAEPVADSDAATKQYVSQTIASSAESLPPALPGGVVASTYVGDGASTQTISLSASITPRVIFLREPSGTYLSEGVVLWFSSGEKSFTSWNGSMEEGGWLNWATDYANAGIGIDSIGVGKLVVKENANAKNITYSYIIIGS